jgi:uncharacterized surface protein with fasciclin (FAS1) repeats
MMEELMIKAELANVFNDVNASGTLFTPNNAAFANSGISSATIGALTKNEAEKIVYDHYLNTRVVSADLPAGPNARLRMFGGDTVFVTKDSTGIYVSGGKIIEADINVSNGVMHKINKVLLPPRGDVFQTIVARTGISDSLAKAIAHVTYDPGGSSDLMTILTTQTVTLFAPTNQAFSDLLDSLSLNDINEVPITDLSRILNYHVTAGRIFSNSFVEGNLAMIDGSNTKISLSGGLTITGNGNRGLRSNITFTNTIATNGVIHSIDRVLLP